MLAVRWLHVVAMAVVLGGAILTWWQFRQGGETGVTPAAALETATAYERGFWAALGVLVMTGVGNLGSLAPYVPQSGTPWGMAFVVKLLLVVTLLAFSVVRTLAVRQYARTGELSGSDGGLRTLRVGYAATAIVVALVVVLAEVMAHG